MTDNLEQDVSAVWTLLLQIVSDAEKRLAAHLMRHNLTPPQFFVLRTLYDHGGSCPIGQIAREHHLSNATMSGLVKRLSQTKPPLVRRERSSEDGRSVLVVLTEDGRARFDAVQQTLMGQVQIVLQMLPEEERRDIIDKVTHYSRIVLMALATGD